MRQVLPPLVSQACPGPGKAAGALLLWGAHHPILPRGRPPSAAWPRTNDGQGLGGQSRPPSRRRTCRQSCLWLQGAVSAPDGLPSVLCTYEPSPHGLSRGSARAPVLPTASPARSGTHPNPHTSQLACIFPTSWDSCGGNFRLCPQTDLFRGPPAMRDQLSGSRVRFSHAGPRPELIPTGFFWPCTGTCHPRQPGPQEHLPPSAPSPGCLHSQPVETHGVRDTHTLGQLPCPARFPGVQPSDRGLLAGGAWESLMSEQGTVSMRS